MCFLPFVLQMQDDLFNKESITKRLINRRVNLAKKNHDRAILEGYCKTKKSICRSNDDITIYSVMPPRNRWRTLTEKERNTVTDSSKTNRKRIIKTIELDSKLSICPDYLEKLRLLVDEIRMKGRDLTSSIRAVPS